MRRWARTPLTWVVVAFAVLVLVGSWWNLPCTDAWSNDEVSPRASTLGAVFETWTPGHFFRYPPLHVLLLTVLQSPVILVAGLRVGFSQDALAKELIEPGYMTVSCVIGRLVALAMACGIVVHVHRLWSRLASERAGLIAAALVALNPMFVYFAHTASVDVPYWFWTTWAMVELDRVAAGEPRERRAMLLCAAAVLTKDQSAFLLAGFFAITCVLVPLARAREHRLRALWNPRLVKATAVSVLLVLIVSGALTNPSGFRKKLAWMTGEGNKGWTIYEHTFAGALKQLHAIVLAAPLYASVAIAVLTPLGIVLAARQMPEKRVRSLAPLAAATSYLMLFVIPSRWTMERHLLPLALMLVPYASLVFDAAFERWPRLRKVHVAVLALVVLPMLRDVASIDGTLVADSRNQVTRWLETLPPGTRVEVYGGTQYLPHLPRQLSLTRVGPEPVDLRSPLPGVDEIVGPFGDIGQRDPRYLVVGETFARLYLPRGERRDARDARAGSDPDGHPFFEALVDESGAYEWQMRAKCELPWPLQCKRVHASTGAETWVFRKKPR